jgi:hypothetical protein
MRSVRSITKIGLTITALLSLSFIASSQVSQKDLFDLHVSKIKRVNEGCTVDAESPTVRFTISSDVSATCGMLRAGETYRAFRGTMENDPKDETKDAASLVVYNNVKNPRRENAVFTIDLEESIRRKTDQ